MKEVFEGLQIEKLNSNGLKVKWFENFKGSRGTNSLGHNLRVNKTAISIGEQAAAAFDYKRPEKVGVGELDGQVVLVFKPGNRHWPTISKNSKTRSLKGKNLISAIATHKVKLGMYEIKKVKGGLIAVPVEEE